MTCGRIKGKILMDMICHVDLLYLPCVYQAKQYEL